MVAQRLYDELFALPPEDQTEILHRLEAHLADLGPVDDATKRLLDERLAEYEEDKRLGRPLGMSLEEAMQYVSQRLEAKRLQPR